MLVGQQNTRAVVTVTLPSPAALPAPDQTTYLRGLEHLGAGWTAELTVRDSAVTRPAAPFNDNNDNNDDTFDSGSHIKNDVTDGDLFCYLAFAARKRVFTPKYYSVGSEPKIRKPRFSGNFPLFRPCAFDLVCQVFKSYAFLFFSNILFTFTPGYDIINIYHFISVLFALFV